jgi:hypothetical protein
MRLWIAACALVVGTQVAGASESFTNRASFLVALGSPSTQYGFDDLPPGTVFTTQLAGVDFQGSGTLEAAGNAHSPPNVLGTTARPIDFVFASPVRGVGFHNTSNVDEIVTYAGPNGGGTIFQGLVLPGGFLGFVSDTPIGLGTIGWIGPPNSHFSIDSFVFRSIGSVPVPATGWKALGALWTGLLVAAAFGLRRPTRPGGLESAGHAGF